MWFHNILEYINKNRRMTVLICVVVAFVLYVLIDLSAVVSKSMNHFSQKENLFPKYEKEVNLFQSMSSSEQQEYLNLDRDAKLIKYGSKLV